MLSYFFIKQKFSNYVKNNFYLDYGLKFIAKVFVYNVYIQLSFFFAEKFIVEYYTRFMFNYFAVSVNPIVLKLGAGSMFSYLILLTANIIIVML